MNRTAHVGTVCRSTRDCGWSTWLCVAVPPAFLQIQAAIAALHAEAKTPADTDWTQIAVLYAELERLEPSPVISLNRAVAIAMSRSLDEGLAIIDSFGKGSKIRPLLSLSRGAGRPP